LDHKELKQKRKKKKKRWPKSPLYALEMVEIIPTGLGGSQPPLEGYKIKIKNG
jgi:hypothetical protein